MKGCTPMDILCMCMRACGAVWVTHLGPLLFSAGETLRALPPSGPYHLQSSAGWSTAIYTPYSCVCVCVCVCMHVRACVLCACACCVCIHSLRKNTRTHAHMVIFLQHTSDSSDWSSSSSESTAHRRRK